MFILPGSFKWCIYGNNGTFLSLLGVLIVHNIPCWDFPNPIKGCLIKVHSLKGQIDCLSESLFFGFFKYRRDFKSFKCNSALEFQIGYLQTPVKQARSILTTLQMFTSPVRL